MSERRSAKLVVVLLIMAMLSTFVFTGCKATAQKSEFTFVAAQYSNATQPYFTDLIVNFEKENPDIKVNLQVVGWDVIREKVNTLISTKQAPDLLNLDYFAGYVKDDLLMDASKVISPELKAKFYDSMYKGDEIDGINYAIPLVVSIRSLYYNKDIFAKAGIASPPKTWTELKQDARTIKDKTGIDAFGIEMTEFEGEAFFSYFTFGNGGGWKKDGKWALNSPENVLAINFMNDLINTDKVTNPKPTAITRDELQKVFSAGKLAMILTANFFPTLLKTDAPKLNYGIAPMPVNDGKPQTTLFVQDSLMVFKSAKNPQAIGKFLDYFYKDENYQDFLTKEGFLPATKSVGDTMSAQDPVTAEFIQELSAAQTFPVEDVRFPEIRVEAIKAMQKVILGESSVDSALNDLQKKAEGE